MMNLAGSAYPAVSLASPGAQPPSLRHSSSRPGPAARWIAPSTPPPPRSAEFAALTMASMSSVVMSACRAVSRAVIVCSTGGAGCFGRRQRARSCGLPGELASVPAFETHPGAHQALLLEFKFHDVLAHAVDVLAGN